MCLSSIVLQNEVRREREALECSQSAAHCLSNARNSFPPWEYLTLYEKQTTISLCTMTWTPNVMVNTSATYLGGPEFKSRPENRLFWLRFLVVFLSTSRQMLEYYPKLDYKRFLPHPFQFIIYLSPVHPTQYALSHWKSVVKQVPTSATPISTMILWHIRVPR
jgi:hypothetical protein